MYIDGIRIVITNKWYVCTYVVYYKTTHACTQKCSPTHVDICDDHDKRIHSTHQTHMQLLKLRL